MVDICIQGVGMMSVMAGEGEKGREQLGGMVRGDGLKIIEICPSCGMSLKGVMWAVVRGAESKETTKKGWVSDRSDSYAKVPFTVEQVKCAVMDYDRYKTPGSDGFTLAFLKDNLSVLGQDMMAMLREFYHSGKFVKSINTTFICRISW